MFKKHAEVGNEGSRLLDHQSLKMGCLVFGPDKAWAFAQIRARFKQLKLPDCIQLACAGVASAEVFLNNDDRLAGIQMEGIQAVCGLSDWYREHVGSTPE